MILFISRTKNESTCTNKKGITTTVVINNNDKNNCNSIDKISIVKYCFKLYINFKYGLLLFKGSASTKHEDSLTYLRLMFD